MFSLKEIRRLYLKSLGEESSNLSRRRFLKTTAQAGLAYSFTYLLPGCTGQNSGQPATGKTGQMAPKVAIVGAGLGGLSAGYALKKGGIDAKIFEAGKRVGGRVLTGRNLVGEGINAEIGAEFIDTNHKALRQLCEEMGLSLMDTQQESELKLKTNVFRFKNKNYSESDLIAAFKEYSPKIQKDIDSLPAEFNYKNPNGAEKLDNISLDQYLKDIGMDNWVGDLLRAAYTGELGLDPQELSCINLLALLNPDVAQGKFELFGESDERYKVIGGNDLIPTKLAEKLEGQIALEHVLTRIKSEENGYTLTFENGKEEKADFVVMAIPFSVLRNIDVQVELPPIKKKCIQEVGYGTNTKMFLGYDERVWRKAGYAGFMYNERIHTGWESSQLQANNEGPGGFTVFAGGAEGANMKITDFQQYVDIVDKTFKGSGKAFNNKKSIMNWSRNPLSNGSYSCYKVGQYTSIGGAEGEPVGNILFAGEHCSVEFQGFMNGAVETGQAAAEQILASVNHVREN